VIEIKCISASALTADQQMVWRRIRASEPAFDSGYFSPEFALLVAGVRNDVQIAVFCEHGRIVGFFPFHRRRFAPIRPVGSILSDFHGAIVEPGIVWDWDLLLRDCGTPWFEYDHLIDSRAGKSFSTNLACISPFIEINGDFDAYLARQRKKKQEIAQTQRKIRKVEREIGPLRFEYEGEDARSWETLIRWKSDQYQRTGATNPFAYKWASRLLENISRSRSPDLKGIVSSLYFGDRLAAVHFGFSSGGILHWWFPAYDTALSQYSPGMILLLETIRTAYDSGIARIDLGKGEERYKLSFMTGSRVLNEGTIDAGPIMHAIRKHCIGLRRAALSTSIGKYSKALVKYIGSARR
jgi:CelD/BcsL family acetyltransferase involved in cellulose biosynthesis